VFINCGLDILGLPTLRSEQEVAVCDARKAPFIYFSPVKKWSFYKMQK